ncbi:MAG: methyltransferase domain-containing protein [Alphaproteobacteria bacterium]|nr:methyltransferase domain-containing protein [Alphaproteobacteria bacterium]
MPQDGADLPTPNADLLARIPHDARIVLDIGCGEGGLAAAYRRINPRARLFGLEADAALAARAAPHHDLIFPFDIEAAMPAIAPGSVDALVLGDVLQQLRDPWAVLQRLAPLLAPEGVALLCLPNLEHWSFAHRLLTGHWDYAPDGLLDRAHLRWFTPSMVEDALRQAGLTPLDRTPRIFDREQASAMADALAPALERLGVARDAWAARAAPLQWVWRATRTPPRPMLVVARPMQDAVAAMAEVRMLQPLRDLGTLPGVTTRAGAEECRADGPPEEPRVLVVQRLFLPDAAAGHGFIAGARDSGAVLVQEFDDDPLRWPAMAESAFLSFRGVHAVQVTTPALAAEIAPFNPEIGIFPNGVSELPEPVNFNPGQPLRIFFGALNRSEDAAPFLPALAQALREAQGRLAITVLHDAQTFAALDTPYKSFVPSADYATYRATMASCELAFLPLADNRFNRLKSDLKAVEAGAHRLCCLASPTLYRDTLRDGETAILTPDPAALLSTLRGLLANPDAARHIADAARDWVRAERMTAYQARRRLDWYRDLWSRRAALDAALAARLAPAARAA